MTGHFRKHVIERRPRWHSGNDTAAGDVGLDPGHVVRAPYAAARMGEIQRAVRRLLPVECQSCANAHRTGCRVSIIRRAGRRITTNVKHRAEWLGRVRDDRMVLNADGLIAHRCWMDIPEHFPGVKVDAFLVMPDHVHGLIIIDDASFPGNGRDFLIGARHAWPLPKNPWP
jgi:hypothetical protein